MKQLEIRNRRDFQRLFEESRLTPEMFYKKVMKVIDIENEAEMLVGGDMSDYKYANIKSAGFGVYQTLKAPAFDTNSKETQDSKNEAAIAGCFFFSNFVFGSFCLIFLCVCVCAYCQNNTKHNDTGFLVLCVCVCVFFANCYLSTHKSMK